MVKQLTTLIFLALFFSQANGAEVIAEVDRTSITDGQSLLLTITANGVSGELDTRALEKDFDIVSQSRSSNIQIINGSMNRSIDWRLVLLPKRGGRLEIPAIAVEGVSSQPINIRVDPAVVGQSNAGADQDIFIDVSLTPQTLYVQQRAIYSLKIYHAVNMAEASLMMPSLDGAQFEQMGEDKAYTEQRGGKNFRVIERLFSFVAESAGELNISPAVVQAQVAANDAYRQRRFSGFLTQNKPVRIKSRAIPVTVKAKPAGFSGKWWLPAESLTITREWPKDLTEINIGDSITQTIQLSATGLSGHQLPEIAASTIDGLNIYPDKAEQSTGLSGRTLLGQRTEKWAIIATQAGTYTLPEISIHWWDTVNEKARTAKLAAQTFVVLPASENAITQGAESNPGSTALKGGTTNLARQNVEQSNGASSQVLLKDNVWFWATCLIAFIWLVTLFIFWWVWKSHLDSKLLSENNEAAGQSNISINILEKNCRGANPAQIKNSLLEWARCQWPTSPPVSVLEIGQRLNSPSIQIFMSQLDAVHYSGSDGQLDLSTEQLIKQIKQVLAEQEKERESGSKVLPAI